MLQSEYKINPSLCPCSQLQDLLCQNRECIEKFFRQFFGSRVEKQKKIKAKNIESVLQKKSAKRYLQELTSKIFMFKIKSETWNLKPNYGPHFLSVNSFQPFSMRATICICQVVQCLPYAGFFSQAYNKSLFGLVEALA